MKVDYISHMGDDLTVVNAARVSFDKSSQLEAHTVAVGRGVQVTHSFAESDKKLINYLAKHGHWTPFSHPQITMRYTVPIFVARQEFKHIVGFTRNEVSRRYVDDTPEFFTPKEWRSRPEGSVKQGSGSDVITKMENVFNLGAPESPQITYESFCKDITHYYQCLLKAGVAPEQARMVLPQSMYTSYYITGSLAAFARMVKQRSDPHAQVEIQELAAMVSEVVAPLYPVSWEALTSGG